MRILYVVHQLLPPRHVAGTEIYSIQLAQAMQRRGHDVEMFFTESYPDREQYEIGTGTFAGLHYHEAIFRHQFEDFESTYENPRMEALFEQVLDATRPDLVHVQHLALHSIGYLAQIRRRGLPIVYTLHEYLLMCPADGQLLRPGLELCSGPEPRACAACVPHLPPPSQSPDLPSAILRRTATIQDQLRHVDLFISPSAFLRDRFVDGGWIEPSRIIHSDNGFAVDAFQSVARTESEHLRVGYIGTIADYKGVHLLIEAFADIDPQRARCAIWGNLETFPDYSAKLQTMQLPPGVALRGRFDHADVAQVLADIDLLVIPSLWFENSPLTIHEAYLAGLPVIATDAGGMAELVEDGVSGLLFRRGDAADLRAKIQRCLNDPELLQALRRGGGSVKPIDEDAALMEARYTSTLSPE